MIIKRKLKYLRKLDLYFSIFFESLGMSQSQFNIKNIQKEIRPFWIQSNSAFTHLFVLGEKNDDEEQENLSLYQMDFGPSGVSGTRRFDLPEDIVLPIINVQTSLFGDQCFLLDHSGKMFVIGTILEKEYPNCVIERFSLKEFQTFPCEYRYGFDERNQAKIECVQTNESKDIRMIDFTFDGFLMHLVLKDRILQYAEKECSNGVITHKMIEKVKMSDDSDKIRSLFICENNFELFLTEKGILNCLNISSDEEIKEPKLFDPDFGIDGNISIHLVSRDGTYGFYNEEANTITCYGVDEHSCTDFFEIYRFSICKEDLSVSVEDKLKVEKRSFYYPKKIIHYDVECCLIWDSIGNQIIKQWISGSLKGNNHILYSPCDNKDRISMIEVTQKIIVIVLSSGQLDVVIDNETIGFTIMKNVFLVDPIPTKNKSANTQYSQ